MRFRSVIDLFVALVMLASWSAVTAGPKSRLSYQESFHEQVRTAFEQLLAAGDESKGRSAKEVAEQAQTIARAMTDCHMVALAAYSVPLQETAFATIERGGSYADAKMAFETALVVESAAGGARAQAVRSMIESSVELGKSCVANFKARR